MTTSTTITHALASLIGATISYFIFRCPDVPTELPPIQDEAAITVQVEREFRAVEINALRDSLNVTLAKLDSLGKLPPQIRYRYRDQIQEHWNLNDSLSGVLLKGRIRRRINK